MNPQESIAKASFARLLSGRGAMLPTAAEQREAERLLAASGGALEPADALTAAEAASRAASIGDADAEAIFGIDLGAGDCLPPPPAEILLPAERPEAERRAAYDQGIADEESGCASGFRCEIDDDYWAGVQAARSTDQGWGECEASVPLLDAHF